jgi:hypothetical protein
VILLDNMPLERLRAAVRLVNGRAKTEASGGVNLSTARAIAETGVDFISVGALTHSARAVDIALDFAADYGVYCLCLRWQGAHSVRAAAGNGVPAPPFPARPKPDGYS